MDLKLNSLRTSNQSFLCLETSQTLSLGEFDKSKTYIFFKPIFHVKLSFECLF